MENAIYPGKRREGGGGGGEGGGEGEERRDGKERSIKFIRFSRQ